MFQRPSSISVLCIIGLFFSVCGGLCNGVGLLFGTIALVSPPEGSSVGSSAINLLMTFVNFAIAILLLSGCAMSLPMNPMGRKLMVAYGWAAMIKLPVFTALTLLFLLPEQIQATQELMKQFYPPDLLAQMQGMMYPMAYLSQGCSFLLGLIFPACVLYFFTRPDIIAAFEARGIVGDAPAAPPPTTNPYPAQPYYDPSYGYPPQQQQAPPPPPQYYPYPPPPPPPYQNPLGPAQPPPPPPPPPDQPR